MASATLAAIGIGTALPVMAVNAQSGKPQSNLVEKVAKKFNLKSADVQQVFDENRQERMAQHEQEQKDQIQSLVTAGKLNQAQADKLTAKFAELKAEHEANHQYMDSLTAEEHHAKRQANKAEFDKWANDNGIDLSLIKDLRKGGHRP